MLSKWPAFLRLGPPAGLYTVFALALSSCDGYTGSLLMSLVTLQGQLERSRTGCMIVVLGWLCTKVAPML